MAIDPKANAAYRAAKDKPFAVGQTVFVNGVEFRVVKLDPVSGEFPSGQLTMQPVTAKI